jgi:hypothetical protein
MFMPLVECNVHGDQVWQHHALSNDTLMICRLYHHVSENSLETMTCSYGRAHFESSCGNGQNRNMRNTSFLKRVKGLLPMIAVFYITFVDIVLNTPYNKRGVLLKCGGILALEAVG